MTTSPRRIEWSGPEGWTVWADEDGAHIRTHRGDTLETSDVARLFALWSEVNDALKADHIAAPKPPTREELHAMIAARSEQYAKARAVRAVEQAFSPDDSAPF